MYPIHTWGSEEQKQKYLPEMAKGKIIGCFGLTEPDWGSNPSGMITTAVDDGDSYVLNGTKRWITNGNLAQVAIVWAKMGNTQGEVRGFVVPTDTKGFEARLIHKKMSLRASVTSELILEDVRIPKSAMLPGVRGMKGPLSTLTSARFGIAWGVLGAAEACFDCALDYAKNRVQFGGKPIASHQLVQAKFAEMLTQISAGQLMVLEVSRLKAEKKMIPQTGLRSNTRSCAISAIWRRSTPTRAPTTCTPWCSASTSRASTPSGEGGRSGIANDAARWSRRFGFVERSGERRTSRYFVGVGSGSLGVAALAVREARRKKRSA
jgi:glutaryl-CoA dehydrogenase